MFVLDKTNPRNYTKCNCGKNKSMKIGLVMIDDNDFDRTTGCNENDSDDILGSENDIKFFPTKKKKKKISGMIINIK